jgi:hypothetical protein
MAALLLAPQIRAMNVPADGPTAAEGARMKNTMRKDENQ